MDMVVQIDVQQHIGLAGCETEIYARNMAERGRDSLEAASPDEEQKYQCEVI